MTNYTDKSQITEASAIELDDAELVAVTAAAGYLKDDGIEGESRSAHVPTDTLSLNFEHIRF